MTARCTLVAHHHPLGLKLLQCIWIPDFYIKLEMSGVWECCSDGVCACAYLCLGEAEVSQITHADSLFISEIVDEVLRQIGVHYGAE